MACSGSKGSNKPRSCAVPGMNCAIPCAPTGLTAVARKLLSCQINLVRKEMGSPRARAELSMRRHSACPTVSVALAPGDMGLAHTERVGTRKAATAITMMAPDLTESPLANSLALLFLPDSPLRTRSTGKEKGGPTRLPALSRDDAAPAFANLLSSRPASTLLLGSSLRLAQA